MAGSQSLLARRSWEAGEPEAGDQLTASPGVLLTASPMRSCVPTFCLLEPVD